VDERISDAELVARVARGKSSVDIGGEPSRNGAAGGEAALRELLSRHGPSVMSLGQRMLGNHEEAEEILQDTFLRLYRNAAGFRPGRASVRTYLFAIARNLAISRLRKRNARPRAAEGIDPHSVTFQAAVGIPDDPLPGILVRDALSHLDADERELLDGAFYLGFSHSELAERSGLPLGTVKSRVRRALLQLRRLLEDKVP
jgi:RNA polymerase sigma-70 factor (ECF subfamily)